MKLQEAIETFLRYIELEQGYSQNTIKLYRAALYAFLAFAGDISVKRISDEKIEAYRQLLLKAKTSYKTRNLKVIPLRRLFDFLHIKKVTETIPHIEPFRNRNGHDKLILPTTEELQKFLAPHSPTPDDPVDLAVQIVYTTGLRLSELLSLKASEVQEEFNIVGKGAKERFVGPPTETVALVRAYEAAHGLKKGERLFSWHRRTLQKKIEERAEALGLKDFSIHTLRHCYATYLLSKGMDIRQVQELLGHASLVTTQRYTHVTNAQLKNSLREVFKK